MRFLLRYKYGIFQQKTQRLYAGNIINTQDLLALIAIKVNFKVDDIILRVKPQNGDVLRIIPGWEIQHYDLKDGAELELQVIQKQQQAQTTSLTNKYLLNLFGSQRSNLTNVVQQDEKQQDDINTSNKQAFDVRKYLDQQLQILLKYVQKGKLNSFLKLLRDFPKDLDPEIIAQIKYLKPKLINQLGLGGWGSIHYAVYCKQIQIIRQLIERDIDINKITKDGWSPLQLVVNRKSLDGMKYVLNHPKIDINLTTEKGTALHVASKIGFALGIQLLINNNIDIKIIDQKGKLALDYCQDNNCKRLLSNHNQSIVNEVQMQAISHMTILKGSLMKMKSIFFTLQQRYFVLDPYQGTLIRYKNQQSCPKKPKQIIPLTTITQIKILSSSQKNWKMKKQYTYLEITATQKFILVSKHQQIMNIWFQGMNYAIDFYLKRQRQLMKSKLVITESQKNIMLLDDQNNKFIPLKSSTQPILVQTNSEKSKTLSSSDNYQPKMPTVNVSMSSSQNIDTSTSFGSDLSGSKRFEKKSSTYDDDLDSMSLSYSSSKIFEKIQFSSFQIIKELGSGAFGKVFLAKLIETGQQFALKALKKRNLIFSKQKKFAIEQVNILKQVNHPFIINLNYAFQTPQYLYLALDYCSGRDLNYHRQKQQTFNEDDTRFYIAQLILAIQYLHSKNILYRDLKPQNILLDSEGHIKLTDFGLSKSNVQGKTTSFVGTHAYVSPQLINGVGTDKSADLYGIGCILYQCLVGQPPYYNDDLPTLYQNIKSGQLQFPKNISNQAKNIIKSLLQRNPQKRLGFKNMSEIKTHPFFLKIDWSDIINKRIQSPYRRYLDQQSEGDQLTLLTSQKFCDSDYSQNSKVNRFTGFSFNR